MRPISSAQLSVLTVVLVTAMTMTASTTAKTVTKKSARLPPVAASGANGGLAWRTTVGQDGRDSFAVVLYGIGRSLSETLRRNSQLRQQPVWARGGPTLS